MKLGKRDWICFMIFILGVVLSFDDEGGMMLKAKQKHGFQFQAQSYFNGTANLYIFDANVHMNSSTNGILEIYFVSFGTRQGPIETPIDLLPFETFEDEDIGFEPSKELGLPCQFTIENGLVQKIYFNEDEELWNRNMKKSILNLLSFQNLPATYNSEESTAFVASEVSFDGFCATEYQIMPSTSKTFYITKKIDYKFCKSDPASFNFFHESQFTCQNRTTGIELELDGSATSYTFGTAFYKSSCISSDHGDEVIANTIIKMIPNTFGKNVYPECDITEEFESLQFENDTPEWNDNDETSWNDTQLLPAVCNDQRCDWSKVKGAVSAIKNQQNCKSCWAFASVAVLESFLFINFKEKKVLSEQNLQDCVPNTGRCSGTGGDPLPALEYVSKMGGIYTAKDYPWLKPKGGDQACQRLNATPAMTGNEYEVRKKQNAVVSEIKGFIKKYGPVAASVFASPEWHTLKGKKKIIKNCKGSVNHVIEIVGWDTTPEDGSFWIIKNSWGTAAGKNGWFFVTITDSTFDCGIKSEITYLKVKKP